MNLLKKYMLSNYQKWLNQPLMVLMIIIALCSLAGYYAKQFTFDASADTLVVEGDEDLLYYRKITSYFGGEEFLFLTYEPLNAKLISRETINKIAELVSKLETIDGVKSVTSILDAPLMKSPPLPLSELADGYKTLRSEDVDMEKAELELTTSPLFKNLLIAEDGKTTALRINLVKNEELDKLRSIRDTLRQIKKPIPAEKSELKKVLKAYQISNANDLKQRENMLIEIRALRDSISGEATSYLGGIPMVASDMISYVKNDLVNFGSSTFLLMALMMFAIFRRMRWVFIPVATVSITILLTVGLLGFLGQPATVISSNFISLLAIISISFSVHLITKYREYLKNNPDGNHQKMVFDTMVNKFKPCLYTSLTTMLAFASLMASDILPVIDFGWIMCIGIFVAFFVSYTFFASALILLPKGTQSSTIKREPWLTQALCYLSIKKTTSLLLFTTLIAALSIWGILKLSLDSRFTDYFKAGTEIHEGMVYIDKHIGGTIPLDIIIEFPSYVKDDLEAENDFFSEDEDDFPERYWYTPDKISYLSRFHEYLESRPEVGKIISLATLEKIARDFNNGEPLEAVEMVAALSALPENIREELVNPYASPENGLMRISVRIHETGPIFSRTDLIEDIRNFGINNLGIEPDKIHITGMTVLFNDMIKNLFTSQTSTFLLVIGLTFMMFLALLRCPILAIIGLLPNVLAALSILAFMGFVGIPLDMMTITIAAIIIGIGVDDAIHYLHRFKEELAKSGNIKIAVQQSHKSIGHALYFTSLTVIIGFSVLSFSNFIPTIYFGLLTALAMIFALLSNLAVLPSLLVKFYKYK